MAIGDYTVPSRIIPNWKEFGASEGPAIVLDIQYYTVLCCICYPSWRKTYTYISYICLIISYPLRWYVCLQMPIATHPCILFLARMVHGCQNQASQSWRLKSSNPKRCVLFFPFRRYKKTSRHESFWTDKNEPKNSETSSVKSFLPIQFLNHLGGIEGLSRKRFDVKRCFKSRFPFRVKYSNV